MEGVSDSVQGPAHGYSGSPTPARTKIAVIGAGYAGLCALRHFLADPQYEVTAFEQANSVGGIWKYPDGCEDHLEADDATSPFYSRMYRNLRTNLPRDLMCLEGYPFPRGSSSYCDTDTIRRYLEDYAKHFDLYQHIKFQHRVSWVTPAAVTEDKPRIGPRWTVTVENLPKSKVWSDLFDAVIVCNGKHHKPRLPELPNLSQFKGRLLHSSEYRIPGEFKDQIVLIIGAGPSAKEITTELIPFANKVIASERSRQQVPKFRYANLLEIETTSIIDFTQNTVVLSDGSFEKIDVIILCTGFLYDYPFLSEECGLTVTSVDRVSPLYRHLIHCDHPTMAFPLVVTLVSLTVILDCQIKFFKAVMDGAVVLPSSAKMRLSSERDFQERQTAPKVVGELDKKGAHVLSRRMWAYVDDMAGEAGFATYEPVVRKMGELWFSNARGVPQPDGSVLSIRDYRLERIDSHTALFEKYST